MPTYKEIVDSSKQAAESLLRIFNNNISGEQIDLYTIGQALGIALNQKVLQENIKNAPEISREYTENKTDYDNYFFPVTSFLNLRREVTVSLFLNFVPLDLNLFPMATTLLTLDFTSHKNKSIIWIPPPNDTE